MFGCDFMGNAPIRVLHVIGIMNRGGAETMIMNIYRNIDRSKIQFDFVENTDKPAVFDNEILSLGGRIYRCPHYNGKNHFLYKKWWNKFFRGHKNEYKIIHGHLGSTASIYLKIAKKYGLYTIAHSHSSGFGHSLNALLYKIMSYNTRNIADYFFACAKIAGIDRYGNKVVNGTHFKVLNNAIDTDLFTFKEDMRFEMRKRLGFNKNNIVIGHVGRFLEVKNHSFLIDVFHEIVKINKNYRLLLVGGGPLESEIKDKVNKLRLSDFVVFAGICSDVYNYMQAIDVFVFPSVFEGLPVSLVEAQTCGLPCVKSDKVPEECILTNGLVTTKKLSDSPKNWASHILNIDVSNRQSHNNEIISNGYDIKTTAKRLEDFYLEKCKK